MLLAADEDIDVDLNAALKWLSAAVANNIGHSLREPEIIILKGTWRGLTYEQMAGSSDYSTNYLMRDVAPKLWKQLSNVFGRSVGKTNFRVALEAYAAANSASAPELADVGFGLSEDVSSQPFGGTDPSRAILSRTLSNPTGASGVARGGIYRHPSVLSEAFASGGAKQRSADGGRAPIANEAATRGMGQAVYSALLPSTTLYGYEHEFVQIKQWVSEALAPQTPVEASGTQLRSPQLAGQIVGIWGLRGVGKTLLTEKLVAQMGDRFEGVCWQSLQSQPSLETLCADILRSLGAQMGQSASARLLGIMSQSPLLIVLEGIEALLQSGTLAGDYQQAFQTYDEFFQSVVGTRSCVVVTGLEGPAELVRQGGYGHEKSVRSLTLSQLSSTAATDLLQAEFAAEQQTDESDRWADYWLELAARYQGHPMALKVASRVIREIFNGQLDVFLQQRSVLFTDILRLLTPSFERLSSAEVNVLYWIASQERPLSLIELQQTLPLPLGSADLISALDSLKQRSLLRIDTSGDLPMFYLPALVKAYGMHQLTARFRERATGEPADNDGVRSPAQISAHASMAQVIDLSPPTAEATQLSQWLQGQFDASWQSLGRLFEDSAYPTMRLRNAYHLQSETFVKRCKTVDLSAASTQASAALLVAICQDAENSYKVCVQVQPSRDASVLPDSLALKLLDTEQTTLASVVAHQDDTFIQLPYFRGAIAEPFVIELVLGDRHHTETFVI